MLPRPLKYEGDLDANQYLHCSVVGRFLSADTQQGNAQGMDPSAYVNGNPETKNDPTGHRPCGDCGDDGNWSYEDGAPATPYQRFSGPPPPPPTPPTPPSLPPPSLPPPPSQGRGGGPTIGPTTTSKPCDGGLPRCDASKKNKGVSYLRQSGVAYGDTITLVGVAGLTRLLDDILSGLKDWIIATIQAGDTNWGSLISDVVTNFGGLLAFNPESTALLVTAFTLTIVGSAAHIGTNVSVAASGKFGTVPDVESWYNAMKHQIRTITDKLALSAGANTKVFTFSEFDTYGTEAVYGLGPILPPIGVYQPTIINHKTDYTMIDSATFTISTS